jgi:hypothetical protein
MSNDTSSWTVDSWSLWNLGVFSMICNPKDQVWPRVELADWLRAFLKAEALVGKRVFHSRNEVSRYLSMSFEGQVAHYQIQKLQWHSTRPEG